MNMVPLLKHMHITIQKKTWEILGVVLAGILLAALGYTVFIQQQRAQSFDPEQVLQQLQDAGGQSLFLSLESRMTDIMRTHGLKAGFLIIDEAEKQNMITNDQCHALLHYVGHEGYAKNPGDYEMLTSLVEGTSCIGGFIHGIEAEIVLTSPNMQQDLWDFCQYTIDTKTRPGACYHGVGHAAAELYTYDVPKALELCDTLADGPEKDLTNCYRGTFSELGNIIVGVDGHTGLSIERVGVDGLNPENPYIYCQGFAQRYQSSCKSQLTKVPLSVLPMEQWLEACVDPTLDANSQNICVNVASGVYVRETLSFKESTVLPDTVNTMPASLREIALLGSLEAFSGYFNDNDQTNKNWRTFCVDSFDRESDKQDCIDAFTELLETGRSLWMERTDIR